MIPILSSEQIRSADKYTIEHGSFSSIQLMEKASEAFVKEFCERNLPDIPVIIFAGTGNNGGDGLVVARLLQEKLYSVSVFVVGDPEKGTPDFQTNLQRLSDTHHLIVSKKDFPEIHPGQVVIDAIFGSGLSRPVSGFYGEVISHLNEYANCIWSIDIASGLFADQLTPAKGVVICPDMTITFQVPKLVFFQPQFESYVGQWIIVPIGLDEGYISGLKTNYHMLEGNDIPSLLPRISTFAHKGKQGRVQLVVGSKGKMGAAVMAARAAMRSGTGLLFSHVPQGGTNIMQISVPEAMVIEDENKERISTSQLQSDLNAIGLGPGLGTSEITQISFANYLKAIGPELPVVLDADALNMLATQDNLFQLLGRHVVMTPHPGEFKRLAGSWDDDFEKLEFLRKFCKKHNVHVVLKGAYSVICDPEGKIVFNSTGNPGMATGGSGDVLFGMIAGLLGQGMSPHAALQTAVFLHGLAGDLAKAKFGERSMLATDIIDCIPAAFQYLPYKHIKNQ